jgi:hypothetical protein
MVFDGKTKESCPNYIDGKLNKDYLTWVESKNRDSAFSSSNFQKTCFQICGRGSYVENSECKPCPSDFYSPKDSMTVNSDHRSASFAGMCDYKNDTLIENNVPVWFQQQKDGNLKHERVDRINWTTKNSDEKRLIQNFWSPTNERVTDDYLKQLLGERIQGSLEYKLPDEFLTNGENDFNKLRRKINEVRGNLVECEPTMFGGVGYDSKCYNKSTDTYPVNTRGTYGPEQLVFEEVHDYWIHEYGGLERKQDDGGVAATQSLSSLLSNLSYDSAFEGCVNDVLNSGDGGNDFEIQDRIQKYSSIKEFTSEDIHYLKRKLRKIVNLKTRDINECMNLLNLGKSICTTGVADKTLMIGSLIFQVVGNNKIDVMQANVDERQKLNRLIDELGPLIPRAVKNIIEISKEYEARVCNVPTNTTLLLERLYKDLYAKETKVTIDLTPNFDLNFNELASTPNFWFFIQKMTVLVVMSVLLFLAANFLMVFLSRTQVITKVSE